MDRDTRAAAVAGIVGGVLVSAIAVTDAAVGGTLPERRGGWVATVVVHVVGFALLAPAAEGLRARYRAAMGRVGRAAALLLVASFVVMTAAYVGLGVVGEITVVETAAGLGFAGMFLGALVLGVALWRRTDASRLAAALLVGWVPMIGVVVGLDALGVLAAHPAAMEVAVYLGVATLAYERLAEPTRGETRLPAAAG